ncbi:MULTISPECIES: sulfotransferase family protein [unclassified Coleofasciculus]|uniref:sulfotransferase family protein n=1 Tax=unclassified Coleofasciculus TaxID=2692782 RepID=UPI0018827D6E|nr:MULTISPECIES: sulfotransferase [unclassified Coleofasciculus]MBE9126145.1 sulfotransferase [Coleofasciculus sp. LEGE 07081]MBE9149563.1 sulfotransferase [Coleofasciculus sp. LEGE 07092]
MKTDLKKLPFFIVGCPRSGTSLLQMLMNLHPNIAIPPESHIFERFSGVFANYGDLHKSSNLQLFVKDILHDKRIKEWGLEISVAEFCTQIKIVSIKGVVSLLFELYAQKNGKKRWGDKTPQHAMYLKEINKIFPEAKFIHLIRDGRDVAESLKRVPIGPKSIYKIAHRWRKYILAFEEFKQSTDTRNWIEVHYEDLVQNLNSELFKIFDFLEEDRITVTRNIPEIEIKKQYIKSAALHNSLNKTISEKKIGVFKTKLKRREIEIFEYVAGDALINCEYEMATSRIFPIKIYERIVFFIEDNYLRYLFKFTNYDAFNLFKKQINYDLQVKTRKLLRSIKNY